MFLEDRMVLPVARILDFVNRLSTEFLALMYVFHLHITTRYRTASYLWNGVAYPQLGVKRILPVG